jgi:hypothetical protein
MHFNFFHFLVVAVLALEVHANTTPWLPAYDIEATQLGGILANSIDFSAKAEAVLMPRIKEWLFQNPFQSNFSAITNSSIVFEKIAEYVVESEKGFHPEVRNVFSSNENETTVEFEPRGLKVKTKGFEEIEVKEVKEVKLTLLYRASENGFLASEFHRLCDEKGPTITLVKATNGRMAAAYSSVSWGQTGRNPRGLIASIAEVREEAGGYSLHKYAADDEAYVMSCPLNGPSFAFSLHIIDRCNEDNERNSCSILGPDQGYGYWQEGVDPAWIPPFCEIFFRVLEYEVFQVEIQTII